MRLEEASARSQWQHFTGLADGKRPGSVTASDGYTQSVSEVYDGHPRVGSYLALPPGRKPVMFLLSHKALIHSVTDGNFRAKQN